MAAEQPAEAPVVVWLWVYSRGSLWVYARVGARVRPCMSDECMCMRIRMHVHGCVSAYACARAREGDQPNLISDTTSQC